MEIRIAPIGYVRNGRETLEDDYWGGMVSQIMLDNEIPEDSLEGKVLILTPILKLSFIFTS